MVLRPGILGTIGVVDYLVVLIFEYLHSNMARDAKVTSSILVWSKLFMSAELSF